MAEMVKVHVEGQNDSRGYDLKFTREDAERYIAAHPGARIMEDEPEAKAKAPASNKARAKAEDK